jgi:4-carboxymuconolactone decarboxylase
MTSLRPSCQTAPKPEFTYRQSIAAFGEEGTAEFINLVGLYCLVSVTLNGFDVPVPEIDAPK